MLNGCKYFPLSRIFSGSEGQQAADPRVHADIRQRNKDGGPGNWENSAQLFNLQVKRKELLTKFLLYKVQRRLLWSGLSVFWFWWGESLCKQRLYGCLDVWLVCVRIPFTNTSPCPGSPTALQTPPSPTCSPSSPSTGRSASSATHSLPANRKL